LGLRDTFLGKDVGGDKKGLFESLRKNDKQKLRESCRAGEGNFYSYSFVRGSGGETQEIRGRNLLEGKVETRGDDLKGRRRSGEKKLSVESNEVYRKSTEKVTCLKKKTSFIADAVQRKESK